jgi:hypothetical protein
VLHSVRALDAAPVRSLAGVLPSPTDSLIHAARINTPCPRAPTLLVLSSARGLPPNSHSPTKPPDRAREGKYGNHRKRASRFGGPWPSSFRGISNERRPPTTTRVASLQHIPQNRADTLRTGVLSPAFRATCAGRCLRTMYHRTRGRMRRRLAGLCCAHVSPVRGEHAKP